MSDSVNNLPVVFDVAALRTQLRPKELLFVSHYLQGTTGMEAVRRAGYIARTDHTARVKANKLIHKNSRVRAALVEAKAELAKRADYNLDKALHEIDSDLQGARRADQWTAVANLQRTKQQMVGHLDDRPILNQGFQIVIQGITP